jgi:tetratricopeptide (TPR) repeat protein
MLAGTLISLGKLNEAEAQARQSLAVFEAILGVDHEYCATALVSVADTVARKGDFAAAMPCLDRAVAIYRTRLGDRHPYVVTTLISLGEVQQQAGALDAADASFAEACAAAESWGDRGRDDLADGLTSWATLAWEQGDARLAEQRCRRAMAVSAALPYGDPKVRGKQIRLLAGIHVDRGEFDAAERVLRSFQKELDEATPVRPNLVAKCDGWLAEVEAKRAERDAAGDDP